MKTQDLSTKVLVGLLIAGVWGILLKPLVTSPLQAQSQRNQQATMVIKGKTAMVTSARFVPEEDAQPDFLNKVNTLKAKGFVVKEFSSAAENNSVIHFALMERK